MAFQLRYVTHSEIGLVRKNNQDSGFASPHLLVVADGMGGAAAGDLASAIAIDTIKRIDGPAPGEEMLGVLSGALHQANDRIADLVEADKSLDGMGTTVTGALFDGARLGLAHIGDSRAYLWRDGQLAQLTHDHSWVQSLVDEGKISVSEAAVHPHRSLLLKVLNGHTANDPDLSMVALQAGDRLMLCSDGVCGLVDDPEIAEALALPDLDGALGRLVDEARAEGGIDNITVIVADVVESGGTQAAAVLGAAVDHVIPAAGATSPVGEFDDDEGQDVTQLTPATPAAMVDDEARYSPQQPRQRGLVGPLVRVLVLVLVVGAGLATAYAWTRTQYFVGAAGGQVAIFRGLSESLPGVPMSEVFEVQQLAVSALPPYYQQKVRASIDVAGLESARATVAELTQAAARCAEQKPAAIPGPARVPQPQPTMPPTGRASQLSGPPSPTGAPSRTTRSAEPVC